MIDAIARMRGVLDKRLRRSGRADGGRIVILCAGLFAILGLLVMGGVNVTSVQLARVHLLDAADAAALDAADAADDGAIYRQGVGQTVPLSNSSVVSDARASLAVQELPAHITGWAVTDGTGTADGRTAVVRVTATVKPPLFGGALSVLAGNVTITVQSEARSDVDR